MKIGCNDFVARVVARVAYIIIIIPMATSVVAVSRLLFSDRVSRKLPSIDIQNEKR